jgi:ammonium transporter, Amt family
MPVASLGGTAGLDAAKEVVIELFGKPFGLFASNGWFLGGNVYDVGVFTIFLFPDSPGFSGRPMVLRG